MGQIKTKLIKNDFITEVKLGLSKTPLICGVLSYINFQYIFHIHNQVKISKLLTKYTRTFIYRVITKHLRLSERGYLKVPSSPH